MDVRLRSLGRRKKVSLGIDLGSQYVRACVWSGGKKSPEVLEFGSERQFISGPGSLCRDAKEREKFVDRCAEVFRKIRVAVQKHYARDEDHVLFEWVVVVGTSTEAHYRLAVEHAAARNNFFKIHQFLSVPLAAALGLWGYASLFHDSARASQMLREQVKSEQGLVIFMLDIGATATHAGVIKCSKQGTHFTLVSSCTTRRLTIKTFVDACAREMQQEQADTALAKAEKMCHEVVSLAGKPTANLSQSEASMLENFKRWNVGTFEKLTDMANQLLGQAGRLLKGSAGGRLVPDRVILLGAGTQFPGVYHSVCKEFHTHLNSSHVFFPKWTKSLYILAVGAAVQSGIIREDHKSIPLTSLDANEHSLFLKLCLTKNNNSASQQTLSAIPQNEKLPATGVVRIDLKSILASRPPLPGTSQLSPSAIEGSPNVETQQQGQDVWNVLMLCEGSGCSFLSGEDADDFRVISQLNLDDLVSDGCPLLSVEVCKDLRAPNIGVHMSVSCIGGESNETEPKRTSISERDFHNALAREAFHRNSKNMPQRPRDVSMWPLSMDERPVIQTIDTVILHVVKAEGLARADLPWGRSDPYCVVTLNSDKIGQTHVEKKTLAPEWDQKFYLSIPGHPLGYNDVLHLDVYDHDTFSSDDFLGRASVPGSCFSKIGELQWYDLGFRADLPRKKQKFVQGRIAVRFLKHEFKVTQSMLEFQSVQQSLHGKAAAMRTGKGAEVTSRPIRPKRNSALSSSSRSSAGSTPTGRQNSISFGGFFSQSPSQKRGSDGFLVLQDVDLKQDNRTHTDDDLSDDDDDDEFEEEGDGDVSSTDDDEFDPAKVDLRTRWRIISGNVPLHGMVVQRPSMTKTLHDSSSLSSMSSSSSSTSSGLLLSAVSQDVDSAVAK